MTRCRNLVRAEARPILERALSIRRKTLGNRHPALIMVVHDLAQLLRQSGENDAAEPLFLEAIELCEKYCPRGWELAIALNNYAIHAILHHPESPDPGLPDIMDFYAATFDEAGLPRHAVRIRARAERLRRRAPGQQ